jgi:hypothetical protein
MSEVSWMTAAAWIERERALEAAADDEGES